MKEINVKKTLDTKYSHLLNEDQLDHWDAVQQLFNVFGEQAVLNWYNERMSEKVKAQSQKRLS